MAELGFFDKLLYLAGRGLHAAFRLLPHGALRVFARIGSAGMNCVPEFRKLTRANIHAALPELPQQEVSRIARESFFHLLFNLMEFFWLEGNPARIEKYYYVPEEIISRFKKYIAEGVRMIFVNPHFGSWEASGVVAPQYAGVRMVAIAKPMRNAALNELLNRGSREQQKGLRIIFAHGAIRAAARALRDGWSVGTLVDQNCRERDGGVWIRFFGLPVVGSPAPAVLKSYCDSRHIPAVIIYATCLRREDGMIQGYINDLSKPYGEYQNETEVLQELSRISETYIRKYPEQYLWMYKRFRYISPGAGPEERAKYPYYAEVPNAHFYPHTRRAEKTEQFPEGKHGRTSSY